MGEQRLPPGEMEIAACPQSGLYFCKLPVSVVPVRRLPTGAGQWSALPIFQTLSQKMKLSCNQNLSTSAGAICAGGEASRAS